MKKAPPIKINRIAYAARTTWGTCSIGDEFRSYTLEDTLRPYGIKVKKETAIPEGTYRGKITYSSRFKRDMLLIYTDGYKLENNGISFSGIRIHGGNSHLNTEGCILVAEHTIANPLHEKVQDFKIQGSMEKDLMEVLKRYANDYVIEITNSEQKS